VSGPARGCPYGDDDAVYVLGALDPADQQAFRAHLPGCARCRAAVDELTVMPGLLARLLPRGGVLGDGVSGDGVPDDGVLGDGVPDDGVSGDGVLGDGVLGDGVPARLLPALLDRVDALRRRARWRARAAGFLAAATLAMGAAFVATGLPVLPQEPAQADRVLTMSGAPGGAVEATLLVTGRGWGTSIDTRCRYDGGEPSGADDPGADGQGPTYELYAIDAAGAEVLVSSWRQLVGKEITVPGATRLGLSDIDRLEVRTESGRIVLTTTP